MAKVEKQPYTLEQFMFYLQTRCISVSVQDHVIVWFTRYLDGLVMIDVSIFDERQQVVLTYNDHPKYAPGQAYEIYLTLFGLK